MQWFNMIFIVVHCCLDRKNEGMSMSSPSVTHGGHVQSGMLASHSKRQFAESNPHTLVGLQKVKVQLEKEINKLDKQQATAVSNIANHQQAMKMTWRRQEQRRITESPLLSRSVRNVDHGEESGPRRGLFHSKTKLYVKNTPDIYHPEAEASLEGREAKELFQGRQLPSSLASRHSSSPYISSPYNFRRDVHAGQGAEAKHRGVSRTSSDCVSIPPQSKSKSLKLPPIITSSSQPQLITSSNTMDKKTLLKASAIIGGDLSSHSTGSFKGFYSSDQPLSPPILVSPMQSGNKQLQSPLGLQDVADPENMSRNKQEQNIPPTKSSTSDPTLAELFEQIKHCRYIRRYHPDGTALEEYY